MSAIASNPATAALAQVLAQHWSEADPLSDPAVRSAMQSAVQSVAQAVVARTPAQTATSDVMARGLAPRRTATASADVSSGPPVSQPPTVALTPYCWSVPPNHTQEEAGLQCLDLDYISFPAESVSVNQGDGSYTFTPQNCTGFPWELGCAIGWLGRITPFPPSSGGGNPDGIKAGGPDAFGPESPIGAFDSVSCSASTPCYAIWVDGSSFLQHLDLKADFINAVSYVAEHFENSPASSAPGPSFTLPAPGQNQADYVLRLYSGGVADAAELSDVMAARYSNGATLHVEAFLLNAMESAFNAVDALQLLPDGVMSCTLEGTAQIVAQRTVTASNVSTAAGIQDEFLGALNDAVGQVASCYKQDIVGNTLAMFKSVFSWGSGLGTFLDASGTISNLGQAAQRSIELVNVASPVETAIISIAPGSAVASNPVPKIASLSPASAAVGGSPATVAINGSYFMQDATVLVNDVTRTYTYKDSGTLTFSLASSDLSQAGTFSVAVRNPAPGGGTSTATFTVGSSNPQPQVTSLTPSGAVIGSTPTTLSILGSGFMSNSTVTVAGAPHQLATPSDAGQLTINLTPTDLAKAGTFPVIVTNPGPGGGSSACTATTTSCNLTVLNAAPSQPAVTAISTPQRTYVAGDQFALNYSLLANPASQTKYDLMITVLSLASGTTYYYYDDPSDTSEWLHTGVRPAVPSFVPQSGSGYHIPTGSTAFQITSSVPTGYYHVKAYFSAVSANTQLGTSAETDFSVATSTAAGGCFVATAAFGSPLARQVLWLRAFRDRILLPGRAGRAFVNWYYGWSPRAAAWLSRHRVVRKLVRAALWTPVAFAWLSLHVNVASALLGILAVLLLLGLSLRRGPSWWRLVCLLVLAIGIASATDRVSGRFARTNNGGTVKGKPMRVVNAAVITR